MPYYLYSNGNASTFRLSSVRMADDIIRNFIRIDFIRELLYNRCECICFDNWLFLNKAKTKFSIELVLYMHLLWDYKTRGGFGNR